MVTLGPLRRLPGEEEAAKDDEIQPEDDTPRVSTRLGRRSARSKKSDFVF